MQWDGSQSGLRVPLANHFRGYGGDLHVRLSELECKFDPVATVAGRLTDKGSSVPTPLKSRKISKLLLLSNVLYDGSMYFLYHQSFESKFSVRSSKFRESSSVLYCCVCTAPHQV